MYNIINENYLNLKPSVGEEGLARSFHLRREFSRSHEGPDCLEVVLMHIWII